MGDLGTDIPLGETRDVSTELARLMIERAAPDELLTFDEVADEYYADPESTLNPAKNDEAVGFGLELALLAPFALAVAQFIIGFLGDLLRDVAKDAVKDAAKPAVAGAVRRVLRLGSPAGFQQRSDRTHRRTARPCLRRRKRAVQASWPRRNQGRSVGKRNPRSPQQVAFQPLEGGQHGPEAVGVRS